MLHPGARVNRFEEKAAFAPMPDLYQIRDARRSLPADAIPKSDVIDLTSKMQSGRHARLDASGRRLGRAAVRLFAAGNHQSSGHRGSHRP